MKYIKTLAKFDEKTFDDILNKTFNPPSSEYNEKIGTGISYIVGQIQKKLEAEEAPHTPGNRS
jgi:hypothetical protein